MTLNPNASGGFDAAYQGDIVKGASNETITAALPLYFCPEHWECASEYIKPILGWDVTIDPLGYDYNQLRTVPFLLLIRALNDKQENPTEFNVKVAGWLLDTCCQILKDEIAGNAQSNLAATVKSIWEKYETDGTVRGVESVQNSNVFLAYVYCLQKMELLKPEDKQTFTNKVRYMIEEEMRRRQEKSKTWTGSQVRKNLKRILNLDVDQYTDKLKETHKQHEESKDSKPEVKADNESFEDKEKRYERVYKEAKTTAGKTHKVDSKAEREAKNKKLAEQNKEESKEKNTDFKLTAPQDFLNELASFGLNAQSIFPAEFNKLADSQKEHSTEAFKSYKNITRFVKNWFKIYGFEADTLDEIQNIGIKTPLQLFALYTQNKIQHKNSDRLESFQNKQYYNPFDQQSAEDYIFRLAGQMIHQTWLKEQNSKPKQLDRSIEDIKFFAETKNLEAAAGVLAMGFGLGSFEYLQQMIRKTPDTCNNILEKLMMFRHEEYKGASFTFDFKIRKKFLRQLSKRYQSKYSYKEWKELWFREKPKHR